MSDQQVHPLRPTTRLVVELNTGGVQLTSRAAAAPAPLTFADLVIIGELQASGIMDEKDVVDRAAKATGESSEKLSKTIRGLVVFGRARRRKLPIPVREVPLRPGLGAQGVGWPENVLFALKLPLTLRQFNDRFQIIDHEGLLLVDLDAAELFALSAFTRPLSVSDGMDWQRKALRRHAVGEDRLREIISTLEASGLGSRLEEDWQSKVREPEKLSRAQASKIHFARQNAEQDEKEALIEKARGVARPKVIPVWCDGGIPAALGLIFAYAKAYKDGELDDFYDFRLTWVWDDDRLARFTASPAIYMCSNYLWSHEKSIAVSEAVKRLSPASITIHGGPDTPKYEKDAEAYFADHPHVDIIVRGEGEATAAEVLDKLRDVIGQDEPDLSVLADVQGITYRQGDEIIRNPDRPRISDLDTIPSPYLMGLFDAYKGVPRLHASLETNRGCPYGCTFCDWGSATTSKIRKFDLERVFGELTWCSDARVQSVSQADANFGVFERDVAIAEKVAELKQNTGYPETFGGSYAKNSTKYLQKIIKVMADAGILAQGVLSLQTMDDSTLSVIKRSNIKVEKYDALANEMRNANLQLSVELMMGLPGATLESFCDDLQQCIDREIPARINHTTMLVNSPMNSPDYRAEHQIETGTELGPGKMPVLVSTRTYTRDDMDLMLEIRQVFNLLDNFGVLRLCSRFVRQQTGMTEMKFYRHLHKDMDRPAKQIQWPMLSTLVTWGPLLMAPVYSWALVLQELREFLIRECGVPDDSSLDAILKAQHTLLPAYGREFPCVVDLSHDVAEWHRQMLLAKAEGHWRDWHLIVPPLSEFPAGQLQVNDEGGWVTNMMGCDIELASSGVNWDMDSAIGRARVDQDFNPAYIQEEEVAQVG